MASRKSKVGDLRNNDTLRSCDFNFNFYRKNLIDFLYKTGQARFTMNENTGVVQMAHNSSSSVCGIRFYFQYIFNMSFILHQIVVTILSIINGASNITLFRHVVWILGPTYCKCWYTTVIIFLRINFCDILTEVFIVEKQFLGSKREKRMRLFKNLKMFYTLLVPFWVGSISGTLLYFVASVSSPIFVHVTITSCFGWTSSPWPLVVVSGAIEVYHMYFAWGGIYAVNILHYTIIQVISTLLDNIRDLSQSQKNIKGCSSEFLDQVRKYRIIYLITQKYNNSFGVALMVGMVTNIMMFWVILTVTIKFLQIIPFLMLLLFTANLVYEVLKILMQSKVAEVYVKSTGFIQYWKTCGILHNYDHAHDPESLTITQTPIPIPSTSRASQQHGNMRYRGKVKELKYCQLVLRSLRPISINYGHFYKIKPIAVLHLLFIATTNVVVLLKM